jgi:hypothetical protein
VLANGYHHTKQTETSRDYEYKNTDLKKIVADIEQYLMIP